MTLARRNLYMVPLNAPWRGAGIVNRARPSSVEAQFVDRLFNEVAIARDNSSYLGEGLTKARSALRAAYLEALSENWDGYAAKSVDPGAYFIAARFIESLGSRYLPTDFSVDPDGEISINWDLEPDRTFSVSVGADGRLAYAGRFGPSRARGVEYFTEGVPGQVLSLIRRISSVQP
jgi:hypothetical protein